MLIWVIVFVVVLFWLGGFAMHLGGDFIHLLLLVAVGLVIYNVLTNRRTD